MAARHRAPDDPEAKKLRRQDLKLRRRAQAPKTAERKRQILVFTVAAVPFVVAMTMGDYVGFVGTMAFLVVYALVVYVCATWVEHRRGKEQHQPTPPSDEKGFAP